MILVIRPDASLEQVEHVIERVKELGFTPHVSRGESRTIVGVIGDETKPEAQNFSAIPGVEQVLAIMKPFKLASREFHTADSAVYVGKVKIGGGSLAMIAGPCAVESFEVMDTVARYVKAGGANILRGGAFKPRTSPYAFQGLGEEGLKILRDVGEKYEMPVVTEVMDPRQVELVVKYADMLQIGARNMQNFDLLREVGKTRRPVLLKRGLSASVKEWLMSAEYILSQGNRGVILCERGIKTFERSTRFTLDISAVPVLQEETHLPVIVDPSHPAGRLALVPALARAAVAAGADGIIVEAHPAPEEALCDAPQLIPTSRFQAFADEITTLVDVMGKQVG
jgi:3-deoxy-7-phosphoheptulonate synthase